MSKRHARKKGTLAIVGMLLVLSAAIRLTTETGQVIASEALQKLDRVGSQQAQSQDLARPKDMAHLVEALKARQARIEERERELALREKSVEVAEDAIEIELAKLEQAEQKLRATINLANDAAEDDIARLTSVYANMKPKEASALFEQMDASFAAGFLARMKAENAARILAGMSSEKAYLVSIELASRNADIPLD